MTMLAPEPLCVDPALPLLTVAACGVVGAPARQAKLKMQARRPTATGERRAVDCFGTAWREADCPQAAA